LAKLRYLGKNRNWEGWTYIDTRGTRHSDPYKVLVLKPIDPTKTSPTYPDVFMFLERMLEVESWNDKNLDRQPQLPEKIDKLQEIINKYVVKPKLHEMM